MQLQKATRQKVKLRLGLSAVAGGGKTMSALLLGKGLVGEWNKIAVIDTENDSASLYSHLGDYNTLSLKAPYSPERYIEAIKACEDAGMELIIIDSIAHEWEGEGGVLDLCEKLGGNFQTGWKAMTPRHDKFKQAILYSKCHTITTVRRKQEYALQEVQNKQGRLVQAPVKLGLKEITREGWEYEVTLNLEIDVRHMAMSTKDRTGLFANADPFIITEETGKLIKDWCDKGIDVAAIEAAEKKAAEEKLQAEKAAKEKAITDATKSINDCTTLEKLQETYLALPDDLKVALKKVTSEKKTALTPATATT